MSKVRNNEIDIFRGIGIILMVMGHSGFPLTHYIYLFHMAIFFMISGYLYKDKDSDSVTSFFKFLLRKLKSLWIPHILGVAFFTLFNNLLIKLGLLCSNEAYSALPSGLQESIRPYALLSPAQMANKIFQALKFGVNTEFTNAFWFFRALLVVAVGYCFIDFVLKKMLKNEKAIDIMHCAIAAALLMFGFVLAIRQNRLHFLDTPASVYILYVIGAIMKKYDVMNKFNNIIDAKKYLNIILLSALGGLLYAMGRLGNIELAANQYVNPIFLLVCSITGWFFVWIISHNLTSIKIINKPLTIAGRETLIILIIHFLAFKLVNELQILIYNYDSALLASFPTLKSDGLWWIVYTVVGVSVPVVIKIFVIDKLFSLAKRLRVKKELK